MSAITQNGTVKLSYCFSPLLSGEYRNNERATDILQILNVRARK